MRAAAEGIAKGLPGRIAREPPTKQGLARGSAEHACHGDRQHMRVLSGILAQLRMLFSRGALLFVIRAAAVTSMAFAGALGFLAAARSSARYDPHSFAIGTATLFGAACGAMAS